MIENKYQRNPIYFEPVNGLLNINNVPEQFVPLTCFDIAPYYFISNYGRIFLIYENCFLNYNTDDIGNYIKEFKLNNGGISRFRIHRLVLTTFGYIEGCEDMPVVYKDGNRTNLFVGNLQWGDYKDLRRPNRNSNLSRETVIEICKLLEAGYSIKYISEKFNVSYLTVSAIQQKRSYTDISKNFNLVQRKVNTNLDDNQVHKLCQYFQNNIIPDGMTIKEYCKFGLISIGIEDPTSLEVRSALKIRSRDTRKNISMNYNF